MNLKKIVLAFSFIIFGSTHLDANEDFYQNVFSYKNTFALGDEMFRCDEVDANDNIKPETSIEVRRVVLNVKSLIEALGVKIDGTLKSEHAQGYYVYVEQEGVSYRTSFTISKTGLVESKWTQINDVFEVKRNTLIFSDEKAEYVVERGRLQLVNGTETVLIQSSIQVPVKCSSKYF